MNTFASLIMTPAEIASWKASLKAMANDADYIAEIAAENARINSEIDQCWSIWEKDNA